MARAAGQLDHVSVVDLYAEYPDLQIDVDVEQSRLQAHGAVVFLHPLYWYSTPAMLKQWQDLVLEYGFAYGQGGTALAGKPMMIAFSAGGEAGAYVPGGANRFTIDEFLRPLEQTAHLCRMPFLPPLAFFGSRHDDVPARLPAHLESWRNRLRSLVEGRDGNADACLEPSSMPSRP
jgi:putative NADPH-quinone reductase